MGNNIAYYRIQHGLTQKALAEKTGLAKNAIGYAENNHCGLEIARKVANALGENIFNILGLDVFTVVPVSEEEKEIVINLIRG